MKIELSDDTAVNLVVGELKASYEVCSMYDDTITMDALSTVLEYYMVASEYKQWREKNERNLKDEIEEGFDTLPLITVTELKENEDGSATAQVDTNPEGTRMLVELGLISLLEKAIDAENTEYTIKDTNQKEVT